MPALNDAWVRSVGLSKITATLFGPASGRAAYGSVRSRSARSRTADCSDGLRSSSASR